LAFAATSFRPPLSLADPFAFWAPLEPLLAFELLLALALLPLVFEAFAFDPPRLDFEVDFDFEVALGLLDPDLPERVFEPLLDLAFAPFPFDLPCELPLDRVLPPLLVLVVAIVSSLPLDQIPFVVGYPRCLRTNANAGLGLDLRYDLSLSSTA
jgi:hypothetical protein